MAKVQVIQKSRKENVCRKCGKTIPVGSKYFRGEINFGPTIIRCASCGLQSWEVTTSDYILAVGPIVYNWRDDFDFSDETVAEDIASALESIRDDQQDRLDNMPEQLQDSSTGELLQERIDALESAIDELGYIDVDDLKRDALEEFQNDHSLGEPDPELDELLEVTRSESEDEVEDLDYDATLDYLEEAGREDDADELRSSFEEALGAAIDDALSALEV